MFYLFNERVHSTRGIKQKCRARKTRITSRRTVLSGTFEFTYQDSRLFTDGKRYRHKYYGRCQPASKLGSRRNFIFFQSVAEQTSSFRFYTS